MTVSSCGPASAFPIGGGVMGALMRAHDWSSSPLGSPENWPRSLRSAVQLMLSNRQPMFVAWGDDLTFIYNDGYLPSLGQKHPSALGKPFREVWSDIWIDIEPLVQAALAGETVHCENMRLVTERNDYHEDAWFTFSYSPIHDENGTVGGMFCAVMETTQVVKAQRWRDALIELDDRLRDEVDTANLSFAASQLLGETLDASRVGYGVFDPVAATISIERDWCTPGLGSVAGVHQFSDYGSYVEDLRRGVPVINVDVETDPRTAMKIDALRSIGVRAFLDMPVVEQGRTVAQVFVHSSTRRVWSEDEVDFIREFAGRTRAAIARRLAEAKLRASEERLQLALRTAGMFVWETDQRTGETLWGESAARVLGISADELPSGINNGMFFVAEHERSRITRAFETAVAALSSTYTVEYEGADGRMWRAESGITFNEDGAPTRVIGITRDITEQTRAQAELRASEARLAAIFAQASAGFALTDLSGRFTAVNDRYCEIVGRTRDELLGMQMQDITHADDLESNVSLFKATALTGVPFDLEKRYLRPEGTTVWVRNSVAGIRGADGIVDSIMAISIDIADRKRAEGRLHELNETLEARVEQALAEGRQADALYRAYFESAPEALFVVGVEPDGEFIVEGINPAHEASVGLKAVDVVGKRVADILPPAVAERIIESYRHVVQTGTIYQYREVFDLNGRPDHWDTSLVPMRDDQGRVVRLIGSSRNITRQIVAEEALHQSQKMEAMGQLTGGVAHDFNNLLTPIVGTLDMLIRRGVGGEREQRLIAGAAQSAERAKILVQRLLAFARRQPLQAVPVDIAQLVMGMADLIGRTLGPQIKLIVDAPESLSPAKADPNQLEMALLNLSVNARDAMPEGGILRIAAEEVQVESGHPSKLRMGRYIQLAVSDTGSGMDELTLARAVEPFFSTKGVGKGTGLGLSMAHGLALQLGGDLTIRSSKGSGTTVEVWLPLSLSPVKDAAKDNDVPQVMTAAGTVLLVDDDDLVRVSTADMLDSLGYKVVEAVDAEAALRLIRDGLHPDLIVSDHLMPGMTGTELARIIRSETPGVRILIISGYAESEGVAPDLPRLTKPFRKDELAISLARLSGER